MMIWKVKRESANLFQNNETPKKISGEIPEQCASGKSEVIQYMVRRQNNNFRTSNTKRFKHHMVYCNFCGNIETKRSRDEESASDGFHPEFITSIQRTVTRNGKQYVERKGQVPNNGDIDIQPDAEMEIPNQVQCREGQYNSTIA